MSKEKIEDIYLEDLLERKKCITTLTTYIKDYSDDFRVFSIHSPWGTGKTTFIDLWIYHLEKYNKDDFHCIYFNAWENDDSDNPLLSIILELKNKEKEFYNDSSELKPLISVGSVLAEKAPKVILKSFLGLTNLDKDTKEKINKTFSSLIDDGLTLDTIKEIFKDKDKLEKMLSECGEYQTELLKKELKNILKEELIKFQKNQNKKIIFFVDELDRCKPTYAVKTLEVIKHFFDLDNYHFILSWDLEQLSYSISTLYGFNMDSGGYLRRFIDFEYTLPKINLTKYIYIKFPTKELLQNTLKTFDFSLRDINKISKLFNTSLSIKNFYDSLYGMGQKGDYIRYIGEIFLLLKYKYPIYYIKLKNKTINESELETLKNIIKSKTDSAIIQYRADNPSDNFQNFSLNTITEILKIFLEVENRNTITNVNITKDIQLNLSKFIKKGVNTLIDISIYYE